MTSEEIQKETSAVVLQTRLASILIRKKERRLLKRKIVRIKSTKTALRLHGSEVAEGTDDGA